MTKRRHEDTSRFPSLGRWLTWVDRPGSASKLFYGLAVVCAVLFIVGFTYHPHGYFGFDAFGGFYALYGFIMFTLLILAARGLRVLVKQPEDFYGDKAIDGEGEYPAEQIEKVEIDD